jgi:hypothetical protein
MADKVEGRCMKCKTNREMTDVQIVSMSNPKNPKGRAAKGKCSKCGTSMYKILPNK